MARLARLVIPGLRHHVTQRGNRRQPTFFNDGDYAAYLERMADGCRKEGVEIWGYWLMPNHVHRIAMPHFEEEFRDRQENTVAQAGRSGVRRFWTVWRGSSVASYDRRKAVGPQYFANYQNEYSVPG